MSALWIIVLVCVLSVRVESSCFMSLHNATAEGCEYNGRQIAAGDSYRDMDTCISCSCGHDNSIQCCGFGHQAGVFAVPDGCFMLKNGCDFKIVSTQNHLMPCSAPVFG
ncbi:beta-microseminoprotein-like [Mizuhopecten yessoensis]|uniref:beta-microseminoprotein-like n=1 Tax=Mizuhopecten yessoensis TaxID=6573 RepID=UPI000B4572F4|nr:beta-microseminoprotein-like [Mizuhopecten yessoensis]